jgi:predicted Zn-dependent peptidase
VINGLLYGNAIPGHVNTAKWEILFAYLKSLDNLTSEMIQEAAKTYLNTGNFVQVTLFPEKEKE